MSEFARKSEIGRIVDKIIGELYFFTFWLQGIDTDIFCGSFRTSIFIYKNPLYSSTILCTTFWKYTNICSLCCCNQSVHITLYKRFFAQCFTYQIAYNTTLIVFSKKCFCVFSFFLLNSYLQFLLKCAKTCFISIRYFFSIFCHEEISESCI